MIINVLLIYTWKNHRFINGRQRMRQLPFPAETINLVFHRLYLYISIIVFLPYQQQYWMYLCSHEQSTPPSECDRVYKQRPHLESSRRKETLTFLNAISTVPSSIVVSGGTRQNLEGGRNHFVTSLVWRARGAAAMILLRYMSVGLLVCRTVLALMSYCVWKKILWRTISVLDQWLMLRSRRN